MSTGSLRPNSPSVPLETARGIIARNLSAARNALGISQDKLAEDAGVSRATIIQLEAAEGDPRLSTLAGIATALGLSPVFLLLGRDELDAIAKLPESIEAERVRESLSRDELETMQRLLQSGVAKNRAKAVTMGVEAASSAIGASAGGLSAATIAAVAIGTVLIPGIGTAIGAALIGGLLAGKRGRDGRDR